MEGTVGAAMDITHNPAIMAVARVTAPTLLAMLAMCLATSETRWYPMTTTTHSLPLP